MRLPWRHAATEDGTPLVTLDMYLSTTTITQDPPQLMNNLTTTLTGHTDLTTNPIGKLLWQRNFAYYM